MSGTNHILVLFAHPAFQQSRVNRHLVHAVRGLDGVTFHDLYQAYPDFQVDVPAEQDLLRRHDVIVLHHPFYWYSCPALLKEWIDLVLQYGFAFGSHGLALQDKALMQAVTMGGGAEAYGPGSLNRYTVREFLVPFEQTAHLCHMRYLAPFVVPGTHRHFTAEDVRPYADEYRDLLVALRDRRLSPPQLEQADSANQVLHDLQAGTST